MNYEHAFKNAKYFHLGRLRKLHALIGEINPKNWDMDIWHRNLTCGTAGCALGWASTNPSFNRAGLTLQRNPSPFLPGHSLPTYINPKTEEKVSGCRAGAIFFGLSIEAAEHLFSPLQYKNPMRVTQRDVQRRLEQFIANHPYNKARRS